MDQRDAVYGGAACPATEEQRSCDTDACGMWTQQPILTLYNRQRTVDNATQGTPQRTRTHRAINREDPHINPEDRTVQQDASQCVCPTTLASGDNPAYISSLVS